jgi:hypothetical protein
MVVGRRRATTQAPQRHVQHALTARCGRQIESCLVVALVQQAQPVAVEPENFQA